MILVDANVLIERAMDSICSTDRDFERFPGVERISPLRS